MTFIIPWSTNIRGDLTAPAVYYIGWSGGNRIKIGESSKPIRRMEDEFQTANPHELLLLGLEYVSDTSTRRALERKRQGQFALSHHHREWFVFDNALFAHIGELRGRMEGDLPQTMLDDSDGEKQLRKLYEERFDLVFPVETTDTDRLDRLELRMRTLMGTNTPEITAYRDDVELRVQTLTTQYRNRVEATRQRKLAREGMRAA